MRRALFVLLTGCGSLLGINDVTLVDGGGGDTGSDGPPPNTVVGRSFSRCLTAAGSADVPTDMSAAIIQALVPNAAQPSGFDVVNGTGKVDGTFTITPVPDGMDYILKIGKTYHVTNQHSIDFHQLFAARCQPPPAIATQTSTLNFNLTGMQTFKTNPSNNLFDQVEVLSLNLGYGGGIGVNPGATAVTGPDDWSMNGGSFYGLATPLPDATAGDEVTVDHVRSETLINANKRQHTFNHTIDTFQTTMVTLANGGTASVNGTFTQVPAGTSQLFTISRGQFDSGYDGLSQFDGLGVTLAANPVAIDFAIGATIANVDFSDWTRSGVFNETVSVPIADPFPTSWKRILGVDYTRFRWVKFPGTTIARPAFGGMTRVDFYTGGEPLLSPTMLPPSNIKLGGAATSNFTLGGKVTFDGMAPVALSWDAVPNAKLYRIIIRRVFKNGNQTLSAFAAFLFTAHNQISIPAEVFTGGQFFDFVIDSVQTPSNYAAGELVPNGAPNQFSSAPSGLFHLTATCGNGMMESDEECDTMGETATCDIDCTLPVCGDGYRNAAAGEICDTVQDTASCDSDCTLPVCGDGHVNAQAGEDCDDGNAVDDLNGCSAMCKFNNVCGNGRVESVVEQCDPGTIGLDTATCDSDCTLPVCGDGHLNLAAGEHCDDGNNVSGDGCSSTCQIE